MSNDILIIEDQKMPLESLQYAIKVVFGVGADVARSIASAENSLYHHKYRLILLDHRLPPHDLGNLEDTDFHAFSAQLQNRGYHDLMPIIQREQPDSIVIGTSSMSAEIRRSEQPKYVISKMWDDAERDLLSVKEKTNLRFT